MAWNLNACGSCSGRQYPWPGSPLLPTELLLQPPQRSVKWDGQLPSPGHLQCLLSAWNESWENKQVPLFVCFQVVSVLLQMIQSVIGASHFPSFRSIECDVPCFLHSLADKAVSTYKLNHFLQLRKLGLYDINHHFTAFNLPQSFIDWLDLKGLKTT